MKNILTTLWFLGTIIGFLFVTLICTTMIVPSFNAGILTMIILAVGIITGGLLYDLRMSEIKGLQRKVSAAQYTIDYQVQQLEFYKKTLKDDRLERFIKDATAETKKLNSSIVDSKTDAHDA